MAVWFSLVQIEESSFSILFNLLLSMSFFYILSAIKILNYSQSNNPIKYTLLLNPTMKLMNKKLFLKSDISNEEESPIRKPRFRRTQNFQSTIRKSRSRSVDSMSSKNLVGEQLDINTKFVKPVVHDGSSRRSPLKHNTTQSRLGLLIEARIKAYKREVTPFKGEQVKKQVSSLSYIQKLLHQIKELQTEITAREIDIAELEQENQKLKQKIVNIDELQFTKRQLSKKCERLQQQLCQKHYKLSMLQDTLKQNQESLSQTRDSLQRLKKQMQLNRIQQLQKSNNLLLQKINLLERRIQFQHQQVTKMDVLNSGLQKEIEALTQTNQKLERQIYSRSNVVEAMKEQSLTKQIQILKEQLNSSQNEHEKYLQQIICVQKNEIAELKQANKILYIKLDVVLKKLQHKQKDKKNKGNKELSDLQAKFRKFLLQYSNFRKQHNQVLKRNIHLAKTQKRQRSRLDTSDDEISFTYSLTPERSLL